MDIQQKIDSMLFLEDIDDQSKITPADVIRIIQSHEDMLSALASLMETHEAKLNALRDVVLELTDRQAK